MGTLARSLFCIAMILAAPPAQAQTYGIAGGKIDCSYASMDQCKASASGNAAQCVTNPYFSGAPDRTSVGRRRR